MAGIGWARAWTVGALVASTAVGIGCNRHRHVDGGAGTGGPGETQAMGGTPPVVMALRFDAIARFVTATVTTATQRDPMAALQISALETQAHLPSGSLIGGTWPAGYGVDPTRPVLAEVLPMAPAARAQIDAMAAAAGNPTALAGLLTAWTHGPIGFHMVIPAANATTLENNLTTLLVQAFTLAPSIAGFDAVYAPNDATDPPTVVGLSHTGNTVTIDAFMQRGGPAAASPPVPAAVPGSGPTVPATGSPQLAEVRQALTAMQARLAGTTLGPPGAPTASLAVAMDFRALADMNIALSLDAAKTALASLDPAVRPQRASQSVGEALAARQIITRDGAPFATGLFAIDLTPGHLNMTLSAHGSDAMPPMPDTHTTGDLVNASGIALMDISVPFLRAWHLPGDTATHRVTSAEFGRMTSSAGAFGKMLALPHALPLLVRSMLEDTHATGPAYDLATTPFERIGVDLAHIDPTRGAVVGLLPASATPDSAACVLAPSAADCTTTRLRVGAPTTLPGNQGVAQLANLGGRLVVLGSSHAEDLTAQLPLSIAPVSTPTATAWVDFSRAMSAAAAAQLPTAFHVMTATAEAEGRDITLTLNQAAAPPTM